MPSVPAVSPGSAPDRTMRYRRATVVAGAAALAILVGLVFVLPVPYVRMSPGPTIDVLGGESDPVLTVVGHRTYPTTGTLNLTTVLTSAPQTRLSLVAMARAWLDPTVAVVPRSYMYPPTVTAEQVEQQYAEQMTGSQQSAVVAGLRAAGIDGTERPQITAIVEGSPADGTIKAGDLVRAVDGTDVRDQQTLREAIRAVAPGDPIRLTLVRDGAVTKVTVVGKAASDDRTKSQIGVSVGIGYDSDVRVTVNLPEQVGGPSAGMMFALSLYDKLTPGALAGGRAVAGTGTIDNDGNVGPIGGIQQKIFGARDAGASVFLAPAGDCSQAAGVHVDGLTVYKVSTLNDSITVLSQLDAGEPVTVPTCG